jgi:4-amino-4-deoxy-L-arabinose transferase-like glycosyltransferase
MRGAPEVLSVVVLAVGLRVMGLMTAPIFNDEAIYLFWGQKVLAPGLLFVSHTDGKPPLHSWLLSLALLLPADPWVLGRALSVALSALTVLGVAFLALELHGNRSAAMCAALVYATMPLACFHDRFATAEPLLACSTVWTLGLAWKVRNHGGQAWGMGMGVAMGAAALSKMSGLLLLPLAVLTAARRGVRGVVAASVGLAASLVALQTFSPLFEDLWAKTLTFAGLPGVDTAQRCMRNLPVLLELALTGVTPPVLLLVAWGAWSLRRRGAWMALAGLAPVLLAVLVAGGGLPRQDVLQQLPGAHVLYPRHLVFLTPLWAVPAGAGLWAMVSLTASAVGRSIIGLLLLAAPLTLCILGALVPLRTPMVAEDRAQHFTGWPAGVGLPEITAQLKQEAAAGPITVLAEGLFGLVPQALAVSFAHEPSVAVQSAPWEGGVLESAIRFSGPRTLVVGESSRLRHLPGLEELAQFPRPDSGPGLALYRVVQHNGAR